MSELREIFYNKLTLNADKWDPYFDVYETHFSKYRGKSPNVVEVGVWKGGSIQMWEHYFGEGSKIHGIDINPNIMDFVPHMRDDTKLVVGDQQSREFWKKFLSEVKDIDVFIEDGGHSMQQQIVTFEEVFPTLKLGSVFLCEDTHTSYEEVGGDQGYRNPLSFMEYAKSIADYLNNGHIRSGLGRSDMMKFDELCKDLTSIHFYDSQVVFIKDGKPEFKRVWSKGDFHA
jgi:hypothetical protein